LYGAIEFLMCSVTGTQAKKTMTAIGLADVPQGGVGESCHLVTAISSRDARGDKFIKRLRLLSNVFTSGYFEKK